ncbi:MAG: GreA/GreB family elongation factor [Deltaproteobacteria bacterium]|nr:GreA/GreB family elongation factor [Deltaproteobacteria bacterium]
MIPSKQELRAELVRSLETALESAERAHQETLAGATHPEAKAEDDKDTRAIEQSYLARGQAKRVEELETALAEVKAMTLRAFAESQPAVLSAVVEVEENGEPKTYFLAPNGGGTALADAKVQVVSPKSPLGKALLGKAAGDELEVAIGGRRRELTIVAVR